MRRAEAKQLIGKKVLVYTTSNGSYVGILETMTTDTPWPWRGKVKIIGVIRVAVPWENGKINRKYGLRPGDIIEVNHSSVKHWNESHTYFNTYLEALCWEYNWMKNLTANPMCQWFANPSVDQLAKRITEEEESIYNATHLQGL